MSKLKKQFYQIRNGLLLYNKKVVNFGKSKGIVVFIKRQIYQDRGCNNDAKTAVSI